MKDIIRPKKDCSLCRGKGQVTGENSGLIVLCPCILRQQAIQYLTDIYANAKYIKSLQASVLEGENLYIDQDTQRTFKAVVKSFLLNTGMKHFHLTITAHDILSAYLNNQTTGDFRRYQTMDFLILYLTADPYSKSYGDLIISILEKRNLRNLNTWIYTNKEIDKRPFQDLYSIKLSSYLKDNFTPLRGLSRMLSE